VQLSARIMEKRPQSRAIGIGGAAPPRLDWKEVLVSGLGAGLMHVPQVCAAHQKFGWPLSLVLVPFENPPRQVGRSGWIHFAFAGDIEANHARSSIAAH
jgi:hypothetical protein